MASPNAESDGHLDSPLKLPGNPMQWAEDFGGIGRCVNTSVILVENYSENSSRSIELLKIVDNMNDWIVCPESASGNGGILSLRHIGRSGNRWSWGDATCGSWLVGSCRQSARQLRTALRIVAQPVEGGLDEIPGQRVLLLHDARSLRSVARSCKKRQANR